jgi:hypothetical protein
MEPDPSLKEYPGLPRRCPLRWSPHLPVLATAALLLALSLRPERAAAAGEGGGPRLPRRVQRELDQRLRNLADFAALLAAEPQQAWASPERLLGFDLGGQALSSLTIERFDAGPAPGCGQRPAPLSAGDPAFDRVHRDGRSYRSAPHFDTDLGRWAVTLTAPLEGAAGQPVLLRAEVDLSALLAQRQR